MDSSDQKKHVNPRRVEHARERAARGEAEMARRRQEFLTQASERLSSSLDFEATLKEVAALAVPRFADYCLIYLLDDHSELRQAAITHSDPAMVDVLHILQQRYPFDQTGPGGLAQVMRTGQSAYYADVTEGDYTTRAREAEHQAMLQALASRSSIIVPMVAQDRTIGALSFVRSTSADRYAPEDVYVAEELARCAAEAIDKARQHRG